MKRLLIAAFITLFMHSVALAQQQFCFEMLLGKLPKRVLFSFPDDAWQTGTIQYSGQSGTIPIRLKATKLLRKNPGRPDYTKYDFEEMSSGKVTGIYSFSLHGANFYNAYYLRLRDNKKFPMRRPDVAEEDCFSGQ